LATYDNDSYARGTSTSGIEAYGKALGEVFERFTLRHYINFQIESKKIVGSTEDNILNYSTQLLVNTQVVFRNDTLTIYQVCYINEGQKRFSAKPCEGTY
jgi:hypothetical protein